VRRLSLLVLVLVLVLAACGGASAPEQQQASPAEVLKQAAAKMEDAGSARYTVTGKMRNKTYAQRPLAFTLRGISTFDDKAVWVWWDLSEVYPAIIASQAPAADRATVRALVEDRRGWQMEFRQRGKTNWMRLPAFTEHFGAKPWIRGSDASGEDDFGGAFALPGDLIAYMRATRHVEELGREDGLAHYRGRVELRRVAAHVPRRDRAMVRKAVREVIRDTGKATLPLDVWLADDGLPRRFRVDDIEPRTSTERYPTTWRATMEILEYGVDFDVLRPPARKVMTEQEFDRLTES